MDLVFNSEGIQVQTGKQGGADVAAALCRGRARGCILALGMTASPSSGGL